jgi:hypothetical protein
MYLTGSSANVHSLLIDISVFCQAAGYTINSLTNEGTGNRLHISKNGRFFNFRSHINEAIAGGYSFNQYALYMNASTGYNSGNTWYQQPGYFDYNDGSPRSFLAGMVRLDNTNTQYHFFYHTTAIYDVVYIFVRNEEGYWQHLLFGNIDTSKYSAALTTPQGMFYQGSKSPFNDMYSNAITLFGDGITSIWNAENPQGAIYLSFSGNNRWHSGNFGLTQTWMSPQRPQVIDGICKKSTILNNALSGISNIPTFLPIELYVGQIVSPIPAGLTGQIPIGELPNIYFTNINNLAEVSEVKMGTIDRYRIIPFSKKSDTWDYVDHTNGTYRYGLAIKE